MEKFLEKGNDTIFRNHGNDTEDILHLYYASLSLTVSNESLFDGDLKPKKTVYLNYIKTMLLRFAQNRNSSSCNKYTCRTSGEYFNEYCQLVFQYCQPILTTGWEDWPIHNSQYVPSMAQMLMFYEIQTIQLLLFPMLESFADCSDTARAKYSRWECPNEIFPDSQITRKVEIYQTKLWFSTLTHSNTFFIVEGISKLSVFSMVQWYTG